MATTASSYAWMAQACYLDFTGLTAAMTPDTLATVLTTSLLNDHDRFAAKQAALFTSPEYGFVFAHHRPNDGTRLFVYLRAESEAFEQSRGPCRCFVATSCGWRQASRRQRDGDSKENASLSQTRRCGSIM
jgi:hypothetical protein